MRTLFVITFIAALLTAGYVGYVFAPAESEVGARSVFKEVTPLNAVTASTTSSAIEIKGAKRVTLFLDQDYVGGTGYIATTTYTFSVSNDDDTYVTYNKMIDNLANTNAQGLTRVASKVADAANQDYILSMDLDHDIFSSFKVIATTDTASNLASTTVTVKALIEY